MSGAQDAYAFVLLHPFCQPFSEICRIKALRNIIWVNAVFPADGRGSLADHSKTQMGKAPEIFLHLVQKRKEILRPCRTREHQPVIRFQIPNQFIQFFFIRCASIRFF